MEQSPPPQHTQVLIPDVNGNEVLEDNKIKTNSLGWTLVQNRAKCYKKGRHKHSEYAMWAWKQG